MTPTTCRMAGSVCIISIRPAPMYLLIYTVGSGRTIPAMSPKRLKIERKLAYY